MNPLVEAMSRGRDKANDYGGDLHTRKSTHMSTPLEAAEFHFAAGELNIPAEQDKTYVVCFPAICSSADGHDVRFKQVGRPYIEDKRVFDAGQSDDSGGDDKPPMVRTQTEAVP